MEFEEPKRARRIRHRLRMIDRARRIANRFYPAPSDMYRFEWEDREGRLRYGLSSWEDVQEMREIYARRHHRDLAPCSCYVCGNPRKYYNELTKQEWIAQIEQREQLDEFQ